MASDPLYRGRGMQGMQQQEKWKMLARAEFHLPDSHHSREPKPLGGRGALGRGCHCSAPGAWERKGRLLGLQCAALLIRPGCSVPAQLQVLGESF